MKSGASTSKNPLAGPVEEDEDEHPPDGLLLRANAFPVSRKVLITSAASAGRRVTEPVGRKT